MVLTTQPLLVLGLSVGSAMPMPAWHVMQQLWLYSVPYLKVSIQIVFQECYPWECGGFTVVIYFYF